MSKAFSIGWSLSKNEKPCKDCGEPAMTNFRFPIWEFNGLCAKCFVRRLREAGVVEGDEETGRPGTTPLDMINAKMTQDGQAGEQQRRDLA